MSESAVAASYDAVVYPSGVFRRTHPDRMAVMARLHGLAPPPVETARVLEIGGSDGMNLIALAVAFPDAQFVSIDFAGSAVARGKAWVRDVGLGNIRIEQMDILDGVDALDGPFDYIIAHGVYAWVPPEVRAATMRLAGAMLSPAGVAYISYNTLPGGHVRLALREMLLADVGAITSFERKFAAAKAILAAYSKPQEGDPPFVVALRREAGILATEREPEVLCHDELAIDYHPQLVTDIAAAARAAGLQYLGEAEKARVEDGFLPHDEEDRSTETAVRMLQADDYRVGRFFRSSLFVRGDADPKRLLTPAPIRDLYVAMSGRRTGPTLFEVGGAAIDVYDEPAADRIEQVMRAWPLSVRVGALFDRDMELEILFQLFKGALADFSSVPSTFVTEPGERPVASPLARAMARDGDAANVTLDQRYIQFDYAGARSFLALLDGTRDRAQLAADWAAVDVEPKIGVDQALRSLAMAGMMLR